VLRYVERNPLRANLVADAAEWRWSSLWHRLAGNPAGLLDVGPLPLPKSWQRRVQSPQTDAELESVRRSVVRGAPFGESSWQNRTAKRLDLQSTLRPRGRPQNPPPTP
jgi:putative transposase